MRAIRQYELGGPAVLRPEDVPDPEPGPARVRVRVAAAGVHLVDATIRAGSAAGRTPLVGRPYLEARATIGKTVLVP